MAIGDVKSSFERRLQLGDHQPWPCPRGEWQGDEFVIIDGRHEYVAALMLGQDHILVAWPDNPTPPLKAGDAVLQHREPRADTRMT